MRRLRLRDKHNELLARQKSCGEKMFDAYARAYHFAGDSDKAYKDRIYSDLKNIYRFLFDGETRGFDEYLKSVINSPMPEPAPE